MKKQPNPILLLILLLTISGSIPATAQDLDPDFIPTAPIAPSFGDTGAAIDHAQPITLQILSPRNNEIIDSPPIDIFFDLANYELKDGGNALRVIIDNQAPLTITTTAKPLTLSHLPDGGHSIRAYPVRPDGTIIRDPKAFAVAHFYVRKKDFQNFIDQSCPYLTVNLPSGDSQDTDINGQLCVDLTFNNHGGNYKVRYNMESYQGTLDGKAPVYWQGIPIGKHKLILELTDANNQPVLGPFNRVERYFEIHQVLKAAPLPGDKLPPPAWRPDH